VNTPVSLERSLTGTRSLMGAMPAPSQALPAPICAAGEGCELPRIIAELAHYAFWVELARAATAAVPEKANAPTV
jgi:hypothetical protein